MGKNESPETLDDFKKASDYEIPEWEREYRTLYTMTMDGLQYLVALAKAEVPPNNGISVELCVKTGTGKITYSPPVIRYSRGGGRQDTPKKKATKEDLEAIVMESPDFLTLEETDNAYLIKTKKFMGDMWKPVMDKVNAFNGDWKIPEGESKKCWVIPK